MFCPSCGAQWGDEVRFCGNCGKKVDPPSDAPATIKVIKPAGEPVKVIEDERVGGFLGIEHVVRELKMLGFSTLFPIADVMKDKPWNLLWVRWFMLLALFPLFMVYEVSGSSLPFGEIAFAFGIYFAMIWGIVVFYIVKPDRSVRKDVVQVGAFTAFIGIIIVLVIQQLPIIDRLYEATAANIFYVKLLGFVLGVGIVEETTKALPLIWIYLYGGKQDSVRTITFLGCVSGFGFGVSEAVSYSIRYALNLSNGGMGFGDYLEAQIMRLITLPLLHAMFTGVSAYFIALGVQNRKLQKGLFIVGLGLAAILHGLYDAFSSSLAGFFVALATILIFISYIRDEETMEARVKEIV